VSASEVIQFPDAGDPLDRAGHDVLILLQHAAGIAEQNTEHALNMAHQAAMQLRVAEDKVGKLETEIWTYKERAERAEEWLRRISQEIEKTFPSRRPQQQQQPENYAARQSNGR
jgi:hypothetical protein